MPLWSNRRVPFFTLGSFFLLVRALFRRHNESSEMMLNGGRFLRRAHLSDMKISPRGH